MSEQPRYARLVCAAFACCLGLTSAMLIDAPTFANTAGILDATPFNTTDGRQIYEHICRGCHMPDAGGAVGAGHYPALAKDPTLVSRKYMALTILMGRRNMPAFGARHAIGFGGPAAVLSEAQIAAVINYVRSHFGNHYKDQITAEEVKALDQSAQ
jgi:mono/diheme cytochrome c family protein